MAYKSTGAKIMLILWKNGLLMKSRPATTTFGIIWPLLIGFILIAMRYFTSIYYHNTIEYERLGLDGFNSAYHMHLFNKSQTADGKKVIMRLAYTPINPVLDEIVNISAARLNIEGYQGMDNYDQFIEFLTKNNYFAGIVFDEKLRDITDYPKLFNFSLVFPAELRARGKDQSHLAWMLERHYPSVGTAGPRNRYDADGGAPVGYYREGFLQLQHALSMTFIELVKNKYSPTEDNNGTLPTIYMQRLPYPKFLLDNVLEKLTFIYPMVSVVSIILPVMQMVIDITSERDCALKDVMKLMGINNWIHWLCWFLSSFAIIGLGFVLMIIALKLDWFDSPPVLIYSDASSLVFFFLLYAINMILFGFMLAVIMRANIAGLMFVMVSLLTYLPYTFVLMHYRSLDLADKLLLVMIPNIAVSFGARLIIEHELNYEGLTWNNIFEPTLPDDNFSVGHIMLMMVASSAVCLILAMYIEQISSTSFRKGRKWYFLVSKEFWFDQEKTVENQGNDMEGRDRDSFPEAFEEDPIDKRIGIAMKNVSKWAGVDAVHNVSINMFYSEITVLLGHTNAGKSTVMGLLNGRIHPNKGRIVINGFDVAKQRNEIEGTVGLCPKENILFGSLTVIDNIRFFCRLRNVRGSALAREIDKYVHKVNLIHHAQQRVNRLSPSIKRKLSICCALCGHAKIVLCEEPTYGMDPTARRSLWEILQSEKIGRVIIISTEIIEEADVLADRLAVLCQGRLMCYGTQFHLRKKFCDGYKLVCVKDKDCNSAIVEQMLRAHFPPIQLASDMDNELTFYLPESHVNKYPRMLDELQRNLDTLHIAKFSIHISTLEELFLKADFETHKQRMMRELEMDETLEKGKTKIRKRRNLKKRNVLEPTKSFALSRTDVHHIQAVETRLSESIVYGQSKHTNLDKFEAMLLKSFLYAYRNKIRIFGLFLIMLTLIANAILTSRTKPLDRVEKLEFGVYMFEMPIFFAKMHKRYDGDYVINYCEGEYADSENYFTKEKKIDYFEMEADQSLTDYLLLQRNRDMAKINKRVVAGASFGYESITAWLNNVPYHTAPVSLNMVHTALLRTCVNSSYNIMLSLLVLPHCKEAIWRHTNDNVHFGILLPLYSNIGWSAVTAYFVMFAIKERVNSTKLVHMAHGMNGIFYWFPRFIWDWTVLILLVLITIPIVMIPQELGYRRFIEYVNYFLFMVIFCFSVLPFMYLLSFFFRSPLKGFAVIMCINLFFGVLIFFAIWFMKGSKDTYESIFNIACIFLRIHPHFSYVTGLLNSHSANQIISLCTSKKYFDPPANQPCTDPVCCSAPSVWQLKRPGILTEVLTLLFTAVSSWIILILLDNATVATTCLHFRELLTRTEIPTRILDADVDRMKQQIASLHMYEIKDIPLVVDRLSKFYGRFLALKAISFRLDGQQTLGIVGVRGAGKTSIMKILMVKENTSDGYIFLKGQNIVTNSEFVYRNVGYCPQMNPLIEELTGRETLKIFCLIRGIARPSIPMMIANLSEALGFQEHLDTRIKRYNAGNKRRLSMALAILGNPPILYLDEPTHSIDPVACRHIWNVLRVLRQQGKAILIVTKSMEECHEVCNNVAVIVNGEFKCFGSIFHLKSKFSRGIMLKIKVSEGQLTKGKRSQASSTFAHSGVIVNAEYNINRVKRFVERKYERAVLRDEHYGVLLYYIPLEDVVWSRIFSILEKKRIKLNIEAYIISQTSLDEIFADFSQYQREIIINPKRRRRAHYLSA